jgi:hypothetical protein
MLIYGAGVIAMHKNIQSIVRNIARIAAFDSIPVYSCLY